MAHPHWQRIKELFAAAAALPAEQRDTFLRAQGADEEVQREVHSLLAAQPPTIARTTTEAGAKRPDDGPGDLIGAFKLLENIGEGGFGTVWMAEQRQPMQRLVALKLLKPGMDSKQVIARFEQERQALALMTHPNIAQVFDAGTSDRGRPYFVMELVKGVPITDYCTRERLPMRARLELFVQVCHAVQHAHGKGLIHRDIKPRNVLVATHDGKPMAKVIDFGIAKATGGRLTDKTLFTEHRAMVGTLDYMSPEQAQGLLDIDTRSDIYSLGALLYELLTGGTPFDTQALIASGLAEILRVLREVEPPRPSVRVSTKASAGWAAGVDGAGAVGRVAVAGRDDRALLGMLQGELDWVVMKCLEKDRGRRYPSADGLAEDVERYLGGEAVRAVPPSVGYRVRKFVRKNRGLVVGVVAVVVTFGIGVFTTWLAYQTADERLITLEAVVREEAGNDASLEAALQGSEDRFETAVRFIQGNLHGLRNNVTQQLTAAKLSQYGASVSHALAFSQQQAPQLAAQELERCPDDLRGWEWRFVDVQRQELPRSVTQRISRVQRSPLQLSIGHAVRELAFSPNSRHLAVGGSNRLLVVSCGTWLVEHSRPITDENWAWLNFTADSRVLLGESGVWECIDLLPPGSRPPTLPSPASRLAPWAVTRDGSRTAAISGGKVRVHSSLDGRVLWEASTPLIGTLQFSHDGRWIACIDPRAHRTTIWDTTGLGQVLEIPEAIDLNPYGDLSCGPTTVIDLTNAISMPRRWEGRVDDYVGPSQVRCLFSSDGACAIAQLPGGERISPRVTTNDLGGDGLSGLVTDPLFHRLIDFADSSDSVSLETGERLARSATGFATETQISSDGVWIATVDERSRAVVASARPPQIALPSASSPILALSSTTRRGSIAIRGVTKNHETVFVPDTGVPHRAAAEPEVAIANASANGKRVLRIDQQGRASLHDAELPPVPVQSGLQQAPRAAALDFTGSNAVMVDGTRILTWSMDPNSKPTLLTSLPADVATAIAVTAHGNRVVVGDESGRLQLWNGEGANPVASTTIGSAAITALQFSPDSNLLLVGTDTGFACVLTATDLGNQVPLNGHLGAVRAAAWTQAGDRVFTASADGSVRIWPTTAPFLANDVSQFLVLTEPSIPGLPTTLLMTPDGERLACGYDDGSIRVWDSVPWSTRVETVQPLFPRSK